VEQANIKVTAQQVALEAGTNGGHQPEELITWLFEPESFAPLAKLTKAACFDIVSDHLGTPLSMHKATGEAVWSADLNAYGQVLNLQGKAEDCPFRYPGQYEDVETGLYYNRFRYYDAQEGMYVSQDPIGLEGGRKFYAYVHNPSTWIDPFGLTSKPCGNFEKIEDKYLKKQGIDAHEIKRDFLGQKAPIARYDLYKEKTTKEIWIFPKGGQGDGIPTSIFLNS
jgi:RHS repeat-associated protein